MVSQFSGVYDSYIFQKKITLKTTGFVSNLKYDKKGCFYFSVGKTYL